MPDPHAARKTKTSGKKPKHQGSRRPEADVSLIESFAGYNLRRAAAKQRERFRSVFGPYDIRPAQLTILAIIQKNSPLRQSALGKALDMKRANVVTLLDELQERGLAKRQSAADDRRAHELVLTARGDKLTTELLALHAKLEKDLARSLGQDELKTLVDLLGRLRALESEPKLR